MRGFAWAASAVLLLAFAPGAALAAKPDKPAKVKPEKAAKPEKAGQAEVPGQGHGHGLAKGKAKKANGGPPAGPALPSSGHELKEVEQEAAAAPAVVKAVQKHAPVRLEKEPKAGRGKVSLCHATGSATNPFVLISVSVNATTGNGHGLHADDVIPVENGSCDRAQPGPGPVPEPEDPTVPPKEDPKSDPAAPVGDEPGLPASQREVLAAQAEPIVHDELPFTGLPLALLALLGATAAVAGGLLRRNGRSSGRITRPESR